MTHLGQVSLHMLHQQPQDSTELFFRFFLLVSLMMMLPWYSNIAECAPSQSGLSGTIEEGSVTPPPFGLVVGWVGGDEKIMLQTAPDEI